MHLSTLSRTHTVPTPSTSVVRKDTLCKRSLWLDWTPSVLSFALVRSGQPTLTLFHYQGPAMGLSIKKKFESAKDVQARTNVLGKSGKTDPFPDAFEGRELR